jgi:hypothetical protein
MEVHGPIYIKGTPSNPVIITSLTDTSVGGDIPVRTDQISEGTHFQDMILYSGSEGSVINNLRLQLVKDGMVFNNTSASIDGLFLSDADHGISVYGGQVNLRNIKLENIGRNALGVYGGEVLLSDSTISRLTDGDAVGFYTASTTLSNVSISDISNGDAIGMYSTSATLDGVSVTNVGKGSALGMYDSHATTTGSTFQNGADSGVELYASSSLYLASSTIKGFLGTGVAEYSSNLVLSGVSVSENGTGVAVYGGNSSVASSALFGNTEHGLYFRGLGTIQATGNWWGDATGPYNESDNPGGLGNKVSSSVDFSGWLLERI